MSPGYDDSRNRRAGRETLVELAAKEPSRAALVGTIGFAKSNFKDASLFL